MKRFSAILLGFALLFGLSISEAIADGGNPDVIHACVPQDRRDAEVHGRVRIVLPNEKCRKHEASVHWSIVGPPVLREKLGQREQRGQKDLKGQWDQRVLKVYRALKVHRGHPVRQRLLQQC